MLRNAKRILLLQQSLCNKFCNKQFLHTSIAHCKAIQDEEDDHMLVFDESQQQDASPSKKVSGQYKLIAERMKEYESKFTEATIDPMLPFIIRLDGHGFKRISSAFRKPFDPLLHQLMQQTCMDLLEMYPLAKTAFTASDEISLIFPAQNDLNASFLAGRAMKICTLAAAYCSVRFNYRCIQLTHELHPTMTEKYESTMKQLVKGDAHFDARCFNLPNEDEILYNIMWRSTYDCVRNSKTGLGRAHFHHSRIDGMKSWQVVQALKLEKNVDWHEQPAAFRYGTFVKRELAERQATNMLTMEPVTVTRTKMTSKSFGVPHFSTDFVHMLMTKYWNDVPANVMQQVKQ